MLKSASNTAEGPANCWMQPTALRQNREPINVARPPG